MDRIHELQPLVLRSLRFVLDKALGRKTDVDHDDDNYRLVLWMINDREIIGGIAELLAKQDYK